jgi:predicted O-methyltransferase YrrM
MEKYSHDQKEKAFNMLRSDCIKKGFPIVYNDYRAVESSGDVHIIQMFNQSLQYENLPYLPEFSNMRIKHPLDIEYFKEYRAPIMELIHSAHYTNVNSTISFFGPMLYFFLRAIGAEQVLEIGVAEGYTSWYLANAVRDNGIRYKMNGNMYYGLDILDRSEVVVPKLNAAGLPNKIIQMDSINLTSETFKGVRFDVMFIDGAHDRDHIVHEVNVLYPQLKGEGNGWMIMHDVYGPGEEGVHEVIANPKYNWEYVRICEIYGIAILRKMDGYKEGKRWTN